MAGNPLPWSPEELAYLAEHDSNMPFAMVADSFYRQALEQGWPIRSRSAISNMRYKLGYTNPMNTTMRVGELVTTGGAALILGCSRKRILRIATNPLNGSFLQVIWTGTMRYISREGWRRLARERPKALAGFDPDRLFQLLEDRDLAEDVAARHPLPPGCHSIRCIETSQRWDSAAAAAAELFVSPSGINDAIRERRQVAVLGLTFERVRGGAA